MRNVKVAAVQPHYPEIPEAYSFLSKEYVGVPNEILENHLSGYMGVTLELLDRAGRDGCDIVTTGEDATGTCFYNVDITESNIFQKLVELTCPVMDGKLSAISKKHSMYVVGCYNRVIDDRIYNAATIFDRNGCICATYCKTHLPPDEKWQINEGNALPVFKLDFGTVGICICYDMMFPECVEALALKGAEIIFHPTAGYGWYDDVGESTLRVRANDNSVYIVTAKNYVFNHAGKSSVIDHWGQVRADAGFYENAVVSQSLDLDCKKAQPEWYNPTCMSGTGDVALRMRKERRPDLYTSLCNAVNQPFITPSRERQLEILERIKSGRCRW